jgi:hypothetical protein
VSQYWITSVPSLRDSGHEQIADHKKVLLYPFGSTKEDSSNESSFSINCRSMFKLRSNTPKLQDDFSQQSIRSVQTYEIIGKFYVSLLSVGKR